MWALGAMWPAGSHRKHTVCVSILRKRVRLFSMEEADTQATLQCGPASLFPIQTEFGLGVVVQHLGT